jgi:hypothetical protein
VATADGQRRWQSLTLGSGGGGSMVREGGDVVCAMDLLGLAHSAATKCDHEEGCSGRIRNMFLLFK